MSSINAPDRHVARALLGLVIESPTLAAKLHSVVEHAYPSLAYRVGIDKDGTVTWLDADGKVYTVDPKTGWFERAVVDIGAKLPIEWLL